MKVRYCLLYGRLSRNDDDCTSCCGRPRPRRWAILSNAAYRCEKMSHTSLKGTECRAELKLTCPNPRKRLKVIDETDRDTSMSTNGK